MYNQEVITTIRSIISSIQITLKAFPPEETEREVIIEMLALKFKEQFSLLNPQEYDETLTIVGNELLLSWEKEKESSWGEHGHDIVTSKPSYLSLIALNKMVFSSCRL